VSGHHCPLIQSNTIQAKPLASASHLQPRPSPAAALVGLHRKREAYTVTLTELEQAIGGVLCCGHYHLAMDIGMDG
jgi:hypothetical protein